MKRQHYVVPALMLLTGVAWGDGYRGYHGYSPYGVYGNPYHPNMQFHNHQGYYPKPFYNPYASGATAIPYGRYSTPYAPGNPYTPYSSPNPYKINGNPYAANAISTPYNGSPYRARTPYRTYGSPYQSNPAINPYFPNPFGYSYNANPNYLSNPYGAYENLYQSPANYPYSTGAQQFYQSRGYYQGTLSTPNSVPPLYEPYGNPYFPDAFNAPNGSGYQYDLGNNQSNLFEQ
jgi:hypothetical protein